MEREREHVGIFKGGGGGGVAGVKSVFSECSGAMLQHEAIGHFVVILWNGSIKQAHCQKIRLRRTAQQTWSPDLGLPGSVSARNSTKWMGPE